MKLKNIVALAALGLSFAACDDIKESERFIPVTPEASTTKNVLIEDFTGMNCINCPNAAEEIHKIQTAYGAEKIIAVAVHGEMPGLSGPLANDLGTEYFNHWGVETLPIGMVDRQGLENYTSWMATADARLKAQVTPLSLSLENSTYNEDTRSITVQVQALAGADLTAKLQVWITESNIKSFQKMPDGSINTNYVHNHVLRDAVNGTWGEPITFEAGVAQQVTYTYEVPETWNAENLAVVAFVYNDGGVVQVEEKTFNDTENPLPVVKPELAFEYDGNVLEDGATLTLEAQNGTAATLAEALAVKNLGQQPLVATATLEILEDVSGTAFTLNAFGETAVVETAKATVEGEVAAGEKSFAGLSATFAEGVYGTVKAKLTVTAGEVSKAVLVNFVNPAPVAPEVPFQLVYNGAVLEDGATLDIAAIITDLTEFMPDYYLVEAKTNDTENGIALNIHNLTGDVISATVDVEVLEDVEGTEYSLCSFGDCFPVKDGRGQKTGEVIAYGEEGTGWDVTFTHGMTGTAKTKLTVTVGAETQTVYVNFVYN